VWWQEVTFKLALLGNNNDGIESRNGTASALLHIDESAGLGRLAKQKPKKKRRPESRQYQTGELWLSACLPVNKCCADRMCKAF